jgi:predicted double-glycine peptidase
MRPAKGVGSPPSGARAARNFGAEAAIVLVTIAANPSAAAGAVDARPGAKPVRSLIELRNDGVVRQHWDLTCGAAAIATLMTYQLGHPVSERQVAVTMLRKTNPVLVRMRLGFSLLDLKHYAAAEGFEASGYGALTLDDAARMAPIIVPIREHGFRHFVVLRGLSGDRVLLADPAFGNRSLTAAVFEAQWANHVGFAVVDPRDPHPPNRMGSAPVLAPAGQALRAAITPISVKVIP